MAVGLTCPKHVPGVGGIRLGAAELGGRETPRNDLTIVEIAPGSSVAAVFTKNAFCAAPVTVAKQHLSDKDAPRYLLINAGNANAGTGAKGLDDARAFCDVLAEATGCTREEVLPFSTGVIGQRLPCDDLMPVFAAALERLSEDGWLQAAEAIMTTDTVPKAASAVFEYAGETHRVSGISKGSGMICPNMATMLAFVGTDAAVTRPALQQCLDAAVQTSFNRITVDGDTSTNDACVVMATGARGTPRITPDDVKGMQSLQDALRKVCTVLAHAIIRDAEGATKFVTIDVEGGGNEAECLAVAYTVAHSPLVKTALYASDANWGRILAAVGRAGLSDLAVEGVCVYLDDVCIVDAGGVAQSYTEAQGSAVMAQEEITIRITLGRGEARASVFTSDLSHGYVTINAEYRS